MTREEKGKVSKEERLGLILICSVLKKASGGKI